MLLSYGMFDGTFPRADLQALLDLIAGATDVTADLRGSGWPCTVSAKTGALQMQITVHALWARGEVTVAVDEPMREQLAQQLAEITVDDVWLHAEPHTIRLQPSLAY